MAKYAAFLRGINVGGHHKVPMGQLKKCMEEMGFGNVKTLLNSGNVVFESDVTEAAELERDIEGRLATVFGFKIPTMVLAKSEIDGLITHDPFLHVKLHDDIRQYISIVRPGVHPIDDFPVVYDDGAFIILSIMGRAIASVLDLSLTKTVKGMEALEKLYGKDITTRNWNTIVKVSKLF